MKAPLILTSPLAATAGVLTGMALLALPLRQLTSTSPQAGQPIALAPDTRNIVPAWLTLKLLASAKSVSLKTPDGKSVWQLHETPAGDVETRLDLPLDSGGIDLTLSADFNDTTTETAMFLTIAPDGLEEQTRHAIGTGHLERSLGFSWSTH